MPSISKDAREAFELHKVQQALRAKATTGE
jgi:hypothetical protein